MPGLVTSVVGVQSGLVEQQPVATIDQLKVDGRLVQLIEPAAAAESHWLALVYGQSELRSVEQQLQAG